MAFINKKDFSIVNYVGDLNIIEDYFQCDDLIAPAISLLNKKGYKTTFCCSGHAYADIDTWVNKDKFSDEEINCFGERLIHVGSSEIVADQWDFDPKEYPYYVVCKGTHPSNLYVVFEDIYKFPEPPKGAYIDDDNGGIYWKFEEYIMLSELKGFEGITRVYEINKLFYEWVEKLPELKEK